MNATATATSTDITTITISGGSKPYAFMGDDGSYAATLVTLEKRGPFESKQKPGETFSLFEWGFAIDEAGDDSMVWASSSTSTGPRSKTFGIISALYDGRTPPIGTDFDVKKQLIGRRALVTIRKNEEGYWDVTAVTPLPAAMKKGGAAPAPAAPAPASTDENLPF